MTATSDNLRRCVIHLGMPKTATSLLQENLFPNHSEIEYLGKYTWPNARRGKGGVRLKALLNGLSDATPEECRKLLEAPLQQARESGKVALFSVESLTGGTAKRHRQRAEIFQDQLGECRVLFTLRHPLRFVESMYFQKLRASARMIPDFHQVFGERLGRAPGYFDIGKFLDVSEQLPGQGVISHLELATTAGIYAEVFGKRHIGFCFKEQLAQEPAAFMDSLCGFLDIGAAEALDLVDSRRKNDRLTEAQLKRIRRLTHSRLLKTLFRRLSPRTRRKVLEAGLPQSPPAQVEIPAEWRDRIIDRARANNRQLLEEWDLPFERYGYPT